MIQPTLTGAKYHLHRLVLGRGCTAEHTVLTVAVGVLFLLLWCLKTPVLRSHCTPEGEAEEKVSVQLKDGPAEDKGWHLAERRVSGQSSSFVQHGSGLQFHKVPNGISQSRASPLERSHFAKLTAAL